MTWTTRPPRKQRFYWYRNAADALPPRWARVFRTADCPGVLVVQSLAGRWAVADLDGEWSGPVAAPPGVALRLSSQEDEQLAAILKALGGGG